MSVNSYCSKSICSKSVFCECNIEVICSCPTLFRKIFTNINLYYNRSATKKIIQYLLTLKAKDKASSLARDNGLDELIGWLCHVICKYVLMYIQRTEALRIKMVLARWKFESFSVLCTFHSVLKFRQKGWLLDSLRIIRTLPQRWVGPPPPLPSVPFHWLGFLCCDKILFVGRGGEDICDFFLSAQVWRTFYREPKERKNEKMLRSWRLKFPWFF